MFLPLRQRLQSVSKAVIRLDKRCIAVLPTAKSILGSCVNILQKNLDLGIFGPTAYEVVKEIDLSGKTCLITGANSGIGLEITRCLSARGCAVLMACRNTYAASAVVKHVCDNTQLLQFYETNLASLNSVKNTSDELLKLDKKIDILILNAGVFGLPWTLTEDGLETTFQVNYLSQYYLLLNIEKMLSPNARVVFVSSESHRNIKWSMNKIIEPTLDALSLPKEEYTTIRAYNISKLCGILAMHYLGYRWLNSSKQVFCAHPGSFVKTKLCRNWWVFEALYTSMKPFSKTISQAASTPVYCATSPDLNGLSALYFKDCQYCDESELARDFHLSFRVQDLTYDVLRDRINVPDKGNKTSAETEYQNQGTQASKDSVEDNLISSYSG